MSGERVPTAPRGDRFGRAPGVRQRGRDPVTRTPTSCRHAPRSPCWAAASAGGPWSSARTETGTRSCAPRSSGASRPPGRHRRAVRRRYACRQVQDGPRAAGGTTYASAGNPCGPRPGSGAQLQADQGGERLLGRAARRAAAQRLAQRVRGRQSGLRRASGRPSATCPGVDAAGQPDRPPSARAGRPPVANPPRRGRTVSTCGRVRVVRAPGTPSRPRASVSRRGRRGRRRCGGGRRRSP